MKPSIILFDGVCNFCNSSVNFIIRHDSAKKYRFAAIQSDAGKTYISDFPKLKDIVSIVLIENGSIYIESTAVVKICRHLDGFWKIFYVLILIPAPLRDLLYRWFAKHRYQWFGKKESCMIPTEEMRKRFIEDE